jgi:hypothetical protein
MMRISGVLSRDISGIDRVLAAQPEALQHGTLHAAEARNPKQDPRRDRPGGGDDGDGAIAPRKGGTEPPEDPSGPPDEPPDPDPDVK